MLLPEVLREGLFHACLWFLLIASILGVPWFADTFTCPSLCPVPITALLIRTPVILD